MRDVLARLLISMSLFAIACHNDVAVQLQSCTDKARNGGETDIDCGGACPVACAEGKACGADKDCASLACVDRKCAPASPPVAISLEPWTGPVSGGTTVTITGSGFRGAMKVRFGSAEATLVTVLSPTGISANAPAGEAGPVDVTVVSPSAGASTIPGGFVYAAEATGTLTLTTVVPAAGGIGGGTRGVVFGLGFDPAARLYFGGVAATSTRVFDDKRIVFIAPPNRAGQVDVLVVNPGAQASRKAKAFEYFAAQGPAATVVGVFPSRLAVGSPSPLEARGEHLGNGSLVFVGDEPATVTAASDGSVSFVLPPGLPPGTYDVTVTTADGRTVTLAGALEVLAAACDDGVSNGLETDVDCGGGCPAGCADDLRCGLAADCVSKVCVGGVCQSPTCSDGTRNGTETDLDCGGPCGRCDDLRRCALASDCASRVCTGGVCQIPACNDGVTNGLESALDCGGPCAPCADTLACLVPADCRSQVCPGGSCAAPTCHDLVRNGAESDVDCGGPVCPACADAKSCSAPADCRSGVCDGGRCAAPTCGDRVKNGLETDVDCGGSCGACGVGQRCAVAIDCTSLVCQDGLCLVPRCDDRVRNGSETDVDCGGSCSNKCGDSLRCASAPDCSSHVCSGGLCQPASCTDRVRNANETDVDCGGATCAACANDASCSVARDCTSGVCTAGTCRAASCLDVVRNGVETDVDCGGGTCAACSTGKSCLAGRDCSSSSCTGGVCLVATCTDRVRNGSETDVDCGGSCSTKCGDTRQCASAVDCSSGVCTGGVCQAPACSDRVRNGSETDVDCGGASCGKCDNGLVCAAAPDCLSSSCQSGVCRSACTPGTADCDGSAANGCEVTTTLDANNCGGCNLKCTGTNVCRASACVPSTLGAAYDFENNANDSVGTNHGTVAGATFGAGKHGQALVLNGTASQMMSVPTSGSAPEFSFGTGPFTLAAWIRNLNAGGMWKRIATKRGAGATGWYSLAVQNGKLIIEFAGAVNYVGTAVVGDATWHHVAAVREASNVIRLYVDGVPDGTWTDTTRNLDNAGLFQVGNWCTPSCEAYDNGNFTGAIDDVRLFNAALTQAEIQSLMGP